VWGDEDRATQSLRRRPLSRALLSPKSDLTVDLSDLAFADSSLMLDLAMLAGRLRKAGQRVILENAQPQIRRLIELIGLDRIEGVTIAAPTR
jgi:anti-anti-sigma factor